MCVYTHILWKLEPVVDAGRALFHKSFSGCISGLGFLKHKNKFLHATLLLFLSTDVKIVQLIDLQMLVAL